MTNPTNPNLPAPPSMNRQAPSKGDNGGLLKIAGIALVVSLVAIFVYSYLVGGLATKKYTDATFAPVATLTQLQTDITNAKKSLDTAIAGLPASVSTQVNASTSNFATRINQVDNDIKALQSQLDILKSVVDSASNNNLSKYNDLSAQVSQLVADVKDCNTSIAELAARVKALETPPTQTAGVTNKIPNVTMSLSVTDEGTKQSDNSTIGELKLTIVNNGKTDIADLTLHVIASFDGQILANNTITGTTGSWSIRSRQADAIELRGRITSINAGQTKRIYITIKSWSVYYTTGQQTYMYAGNNDIQVIDWNYRD